MARGPGQPRGEATKLNARHFRALDLLESGKSALAVSREAGISYHYLMDLMVGDEKTRGTGKLFSAEYNKRMDRKDKKIAGMVRANKEKAMALIAQELDKMEAGMDRKELVAITKALATISPPPPAPRPSSVSFHNHYTGLNPQELLHEFSRLRGAATGALDARRVSGVESRGSRGISELIEPAGEAEEESEDSAL